MEGAGGRKRETFTTAARKWREVEVFMGTHNSWPLLKLLLENGLRRLARNLSKFPERVIYSYLAASFRSRSDRSTETLGPSSLSNPSSKTSPAKLPLAPGREKHESARRNVYSGAKEFKPFFFLMKLDAPTESTSNHI